MSQNRRESSHDAARRQELEALTAPAYMRSRILLAAVVEGSLMLVLVYGYMQKAIEFEFFVGGIAVVSLAFVIVTVFSGSKVRNAKQELAAHDSVKPNA